jgi:microcystin degradation protein MlrC
MPERIGVVALLHESNTFSVQPTDLASFRQNLLAVGGEVREALNGSHHEVGGFFAGVDAAGAEAVPLFAARALPSGTIQTDAFDTLVETMIDAVRQLPLDGLLVAPHGATVSENHRDADGYWLSRLREVVGPKVPIIGTLDAHANLSPLMVDSCDALIAYRTNPHLDQRDRGLEAARLLVATLRGEIRPVMSAVFPPLAISIERQCTDEPPLANCCAFAAEQRALEGMLSNSILLGFPYADVAEMGAAAIAVTDGDAELADRAATALAERLWQTRDRLASDFISPEQAVAQCRESDVRTCLLDMGDNVGGGSSADGTELLSVIHRQQVGPAFGCLYDPEAVAASEQAGAGNELRLAVGGKTDNLHGEPMDVTVRVVSLHDGRFREDQPRHGGITEFDQGRTAICETEHGLTLMLTSRRMVPFSLQQLSSCGLDPRRFRILVAKGVNAPIAAYADVCDRFIRVDTRGSTSANLSRLSYEHRRRPMFPWEPSAEFDAAGFNG